MYSSKAKTETYTNHVKTTRTRMAARITNRVGAAQIRERIMCKHKRITADAVASRLLVLSVVVVVVAVLLLLAALVLAALVLAALVLAAP